MKILTLLLNHFHTNTYICYDENSKEAIVVDPSGHGERIVEEIVKNDLKVSYIVITHCHIDHIMGLDKVKEFTDAKIICGYKDSDSINSAEKSLALNFHTTAPKSKVDIKVRENDSFKIGNSEFTIIDTPGHSDGGICIYFKDDDTLFSGDTLFYESVGRTDFPGGSSKELLQNIKQKLFTLPENTRVFPGHGCDTTIKHEKENKFFVLWN